jgi:hypothetical protein
MSLKKKIIDKAIESEKKKTLQQFIQDPTQALATILSRCGIQFQENNSEFRITVSNHEEIIITIKKRAK